MIDSGVTFIVPAHNGERWLDEVFESISAQRDGRPFEVIAVDDGSADGSPGILARLAAEGQMHAYQHNGFWQCMDTYRDLVHLEKLWADGNPPWRLWTED